jgi:hypothetical protein
MTKYNRALVLIFALFCASYVTAGADGIKFPGSWSIRDPRDPMTLEKAESSTLTIPSHMYLVNSGPLAPGVQKPSFGGALNLKYYSGISYAYLQEQFPGRTVSLKVIIPEELVGVGGGANRLRVTLKSEKDGQWADYYTKESWVMVKEPGTYEVKIQIPEAPVKTPSGTLFYPRNTILAVVEYDIFDRTKDYDSVVFAFYDFAIGDISLDPRYLKWQFVDNGYTVDGSYLESFSPDSTAIYSLGPGGTIDFQRGKEAHRGLELTDTREQAFLTVKIFIPSRLREQKGRLALTARDPSGKTRSAVKNFDSCNLEGDVYLTVPLDAFLKDYPLNRLLEELELDLRIKTSEPHIPGMSPFILSPVKIQSGHLIPFDNKWRVRDIQGLGAYTGMDIDEALSLGKNNFTVRSLGKDQYQLDLATRLKGGIDWQNRFYRVELVRPLKNAPLDMDNMHIEVLMSPLTDTTDSWQKPYRARIGVVDMNGEFMFGPNISLSEGLPNKAFLDISVNNPIPKGLTSPRFDPERVKEIVINFEASHGPQPPRTIKLSLVDLSVSPREYPTTSPIKKIDFSRLESRPDRWQIKEMIAESGGYLVGINYPFPVVDVPEDVLKVPQIYPSVGMKPTDPRHFGFGGKDSREAVMKTFSLFARMDLRLIRLLILGHLEGIYTWGPRGRDIADFGRGIEEQVQEAAGMSVENFAEFLNKNESTFFLEDDSGNILGLERHVVSDFIALLDIMEELEKKTGKRLVLDLCLFDFLLGDGSDREGPLKVYNVGEHPEVVTDPVIKTKALALMWKVLKILSRDPRFYRYVGIVEIMNEPANATILSTRKHFPDLLNFVGEGLYLIKDAIGPDIPATVGFRSWPQDLRYWAPIGSGVDILLPHYWESLESYNIDVPEMWLLGTPANTLWDFLGQPKGERLTGMGEIAPRGKLKSNLFRLEKANYDFSMIWSFSGHDGHNAKAVIGDIAEYQKANLLFADILKRPRELREKAFLYLKTALALFKVQELRIFDEEIPSDQGERFITYLSGRLQRIRDRELRSVLSDMIQIAGMKMIELDQGNIEFLRERALGVR